MRTVSPRGKQDEGVESRDGDKQSNENVTGTHAISRSGTQAVRRDETTSGRPQTRPPKMLNMNSASQRNQCEILYKEMQSVCAFNRNGTKHISSVHL